MTHVSEEKIQSYLDNTPDALTDLELAHLESCERCQAVVAGYKGLYAELSRDESISLPGDFAASTMNKIRALENPARGINFVMIAWIAAAAACLVTIIYTVDVKALLDGAVSYSASGGMFGSSALAAVKDWIVKFRHSFSILLFAGMILGGVALIDKILFKQKLTKAYFFSV